MNKASNQDDRPSNTVHGEAYATLSTQSQPSGGDAVMRAYNAPDVEASAARESPTSSAVVDGPPVKKRKKGRPKQVVDAPDEESLKEFYRKRNAMYSRRKYMRKKIEVQVLQDQKHSKLSENSRLKEERVRLERLLEHANRIVRVHETRDSLRAEPALGGFGLPFASASRSSSVTRDFPFSSQFQRQAISSPVRSVLPQSLIDELSFSLRQGSRRNLEQELRSQLISQNNRRLNPSLFGPETQELPPDLQELLQANSSGAFRACPARKPMPRPGVPSSDLIRSLQRSHPPNEISAMHDSHVAPPRQSISPEDVLALLDQGAITPETAAGLLQPLSSGNTRPTGTRYHDDESALLLQALQQQQQQQQQQQEQQIRSGSISPFTLAVLLERARGR